MKQVGDGVSGEKRWVVLSSEERALLAERYGIDTLYICPNAWALGRHWLNRETGEVQRARCNRWDCLYCGPRTVDLWRQLVRQAEPTLFLTLTKAGHTVEQAARALTTFIQALRRGSKGRGRNHIGARLAYLIEFFAVLERHEDFERNGFHWHLLIKGVDEIPYKEVIQPLWMSATHYNEETGEGAKIAHIERIRNARAIGYVTKYLTKAVTFTEQGTKAVTRTQMVLVENEQGKHRVEQEEVVEQVASKAHRIRYSRHFFPEQVAELRRRLFAGLEGSQEPEQANEQKEDIISVVSKEETTKVRSPWTLVDSRAEAREAVEDYKMTRYGEVLRELEGVRSAMTEQAFERHKAAALAVVADEVRVMLGSEYRERRRCALKQALEEGRRVSRRVIHVWYSQWRELQRVA